MTKKNLKPQQIAPVQREINTTSSKDGTGLTPNWWAKPGCWIGTFGDDLCRKLPFAGDDAE